MIQTQLYKTAQAINKNKNKKIEDIITSEDIKKVFGVILYMEIFKLTNIRMYWQNHIWVDIAADYMLFNRFNKVINAIHFNDNNLIPERGIAAR